MLGRVLAAAERVGVNVSPMTVAFSLAAADAAHATATVEEGANFVVQSWGSLTSDHDGERQVFRYTVRNGHGAEMTVTNFGATLLSFRLHGRELTLNHSSPAITAAAYARLNQACYGTVCGRVANRICRGKFSLDGEAFQLAVNNGERPPARRANGIPSARVGRAAAPGGVDGPVPRRRAAPLQP